ncbi:Hypothetical predicted protein, partial [Paramuricea clavata]
EQIIKRDTRESLCKRDCCVEERQTGTKEQLFIKVKSNAREWNVMVEYEIMKCKGTLKRTEISNNIAKETPCNKSYCQVSP